MKLVEVEANLSFVTPVGVFQQGKRYQVNADVAEIKAFLAVGYLKPICEEEGHGAADSAGAGVVSGADLGAGVAGSKPQKAQKAQQGDVDGADRVESRRNPGDSPA